MVVADAGYKTPAIAHRLLEDGIEPLFPYTCPKTKDGFFRKHEFVYDEHDSRTFKALYDKIYKLTPQMVADGSGRCRI